MNSFEPTMRDPTGAPSPFDMQTDTESASRTIRAGDNPAATDAFQIRAPSR